MHILCRGVRAISVRWLRIYSLHPIRAATLSDGDSEDFEDFVVLRRTPTTLSNLLQSLVLAPSQIRPNSGR